MTNSILEFIKLYNQKRLGNKIIPISQDLLNLDNNRRTNPFNYRGQFSPDLIKTLLKYYSQKKISVFDPFLGCGTVIYQSIKLGLSSYGSEINPFAIYMSSLVKWSKLSVIERNEKLNTMYNGIQKTNGIYAKMARFLKDEKDENNKIFLINLLINIGGKDVDIPIKKVLEEFLKLRSFVVELPEIKNSKIDIFHSDARNVPLNEECIDLIITSPPYINVFNYHQNGRKLMEYLDWDILSIAKSEFGSNRKNRQNRFLTVVQYIIDMQQALIEMIRVLKNNSRLIIVVGKETSVRKSKFNNGEIVAVLGQSLGLILEDIHIRNFKNMFGVEIYEDILVFNKKKHKLNKPDTNFVIDIAKYYLKNALNKNSANDVKSDINNALLNAGSVQASPIINFNQ